MNSNQRRIPQYLLAAATALASLSCGDRLGVADPRAATARAAPTDAAARTIYDGAHGGNDDVFFLFPLVAPPIRAPGFGDPFQGGLPVSFVIRNMSAAGTPVIKTFAPADVCSDDGDGPNERGRRWWRHDDDGDNCNDNDLSLFGKSYRVLWKTKNANLDPSKTYRIEAVIGTQVIAFIDLDVVANIFQLKNVNTALYGPAVAGLPVWVRLRVEKGWACKNNNSCVAQVVPATIPVGQKVVVTSSDQLNSVAFTGHWHDGNDDVVVTIEDQTGQLGPTAGGCAQGLTTMLNTNRCVKFGTEPHVTFTTPVAVGACFSNPGDRRQLLVKYDIGEMPEFLEDVPPPTACPVNTGYVHPSSNRLVNLAAAAFSGVGRAVQWATRVKPAYALDLGVGGLIEVGGDFSWIGLATPAEWESVAGSAQSGLVGSTLATAPKGRLDALHHHGDDSPVINDATVNCTLDAGSGGLLVGVTTVMTAPATNNGDGTYTCPYWKMPATAGNNVLRMSSTKLDAQFRFPGGEGVVLKNGTLVFNATSVAPAGTIVSAVPSSSTLTIGGAAVNLAVNLSNPGLSLSGVSVQNYIYQGPSGSPTARRAAGGTLVTCTATPGLFPPGPCAVAHSASAGNAPYDGFGTLVGGAATLEVQLLYNNAPLDVKLVPITLTANAPIRLSGFTTPRNRGPLMDGAGAPFAGSLGGSTLVAELQNTSNFGSGGVVGCPVQFLPFVTTIATGSLVSGGNRLVDVFFGGLTATTLTSAEANELTAFVNAGGILAIAGNSATNEGPSWNPLFSAFDVGDSYSETVLGSSGESTTPVSTSFTNGAFGVVGPLSHSIFRQLLPSSMTSVAIGFGTEAVILAERNFGTGRVSMAGDPLYFNLFTDVDADNLRYYKNLVGRACNAP